jgi:hypothetical protein
MNEWWAIDCNVLITAGALMRQVNVSPFPIWQNIKNCRNDRLFGVAQKYLDRLIRQDIQMMEAEQQAYLKHPERRNYELNPAVASVQRLMQNQVAESIPGN